MKDGIIKGQGNSRLLKAPETIPATYAEFRAALLAGTLPVDLLYNAAGWEVEGTALNKANLLTDAVAAALGLSSSDPTVNEALNALLAVATSVRNGLMSAADKSKLDGVANNANNYVHPNTAGNKHIPSGGSVDSILGYSASGTAAWIQQLANKSLLSAATSALYGVANVDAALARVSPKKNISTFTSSGSWTPPYAPILVDLFLVGAGGGGGGATVYGASGGGGGEVVFIKDYLITSTSPISFIIGAGGYAGAPAAWEVNNPGGDGGDTYFGPFQAKGGKGGRSGFWTAYWADGGAGGGGGGRQGWSENRNGGNGGATGFRGDGDGIANGAETYQYGNNLGFKAGWCPLNNNYYGGGGGGGGAIGGEAKGGKGGNGSTGGNNGGSNNYAGGGGGGGVGSTAGGSGGNGTGGNGGNGGTGGGGGGGGGNSSASPVTGGGGYSGSGGNGTIIIAYNS